MTPRPLSVAVCGSAIALASCTASPPPPAPPPSYVEGTVEVLTSGGLAISGREMPSQTGRPDMIERLKKYQGFRIGLDYSDQQPRVVSPLEDDWRTLLATVRDRGVVDKDVGVATDKAAPTSVRAQWDALTSEFAAVEKAATVDPGTELDAIVARFRTLSRSSLAAAGATSSAEDRPHWIEFAYRAREEGIRAQPMGYRGPYTREPEFYRRVAKNVDGAVAIYKGNSPAGSGFLISPDWVVTAEHVVTGAFTFSGMEVRFDYESAGGTNGSTRCTVVDWKKPTPQIDWLDIAALKIDCAALATDKRKARALTLSSRVATLDDNLYVIGHPGGSFKQVADNSKLRFPHEVDRDTRQLLRLGQPNQSQAQAWFDSFYRPCGGHWCYFSPQTRWALGPGTDPRIPTFGFVADTKPGNSGSAIFFVDDHSIAGLYFAGAADSNITPPPSTPDFDFSRHEAAIPAFAVRQWLQSKGIL